MKSPSLKFEKGWKRDGNLVTTPTCSFSCIRITVSDLLWHASLLRITQINNAIFLTHIGVPHQLPLENYANLTFPHCWIIVSRDTITKITSATGHRQIPGKGNEPPNIRTGHGHSCAVRFPFAGLHSWRKAPGGSRWSHGYMLLHNIFNMWKSISPSPITCTTYSKKG